MFQRDKYTPPLSDLAGFFPLQNSFFFFFRGNIFSGRQGDKAIPTFGPILSEPKVFSPPSSVRLPYLMAEKVMQIFQEAGKTFPTDTQRTPGSASLKESKTSKVFHSWLRECRGQSSPLRSHYAWTFFCPFIGLHAGFLAFLRRPVLMSAKLVNPALYFLKTSPSFFFPTFGMRKMTWRCERKVFISSLSSSLRKNKMVAFRDGVISFLAPIFCSQIFVIFAPRRSRSLFLEGRIFRFFGQMVLSIFSRPKIGKCHQSPFSLISLGILSPRVLAKKSILAMTPHLYFCSRTSILFAKDMFSQCRWNWIVQ